MSRSLSELHHVTERYRLLVGGSGSDFRSALAVSQMSSTMERSMLRTEGNLMWQASTDAKLIGCDCVTTLADSRPRHSQMLPRCQRQKRHRVQVQHVDPPCGERLGASCETTRRCGQVSGSTCRRTRQR